MTTEAPDHPSALVPTPTAGVILLPTPHVYGAAAPLPPPVLRAAKKYPIQSSSKEALWKRCRQAYAYHYEQRLESAIPPAPALAFGSFFHKGLENHFAGATTFTGLIDDEVEKEKAAYIERYTGIVGVPPAKLSVDEIDNIADMARQVLYNYFLHYSWDNPLKSKGLRYVAKEQHFVIKIPGTHGWVQGYLDGIAIDDHENLYVIDHKTYTRRPKFADQEVNGQFMLYMWVASQIYGRPFTGVVYDGVAKELPKPVEVLKSGDRLTTDKKKLEDYTFRSYTAKIKDMGFNPSDYGNELRMLKARDEQEQTPFFTRWLVTYGPEAVDNFEREFVATYREMASAKTPRYRNLSSFNCGGCQFRELCFAEYLGRDHEWVRKTKFRTKAPSAR